MHVIHSFSPLRTHMHMHLVVEPCFCPPGGPLVLDGWSELRPNAPPSMKVYAAKLQIFFNQHPFSLADSAARSTSRNYHCWVFH
jgi:hypothetical protein